MIVLDAHAAVTPAGNPVDAPMPVAPVVAIVISGVNAILIHNVGDDDGVAAVIIEVTVIVPVAYKVPQPPVNGML